MTKKRRSRRTSSSTGSRRRRNPSTAPKVRPFVRSLAERATTSQVDLKPGKPTTIDGRLRLYWHVYFKGHKAGHVAIDHPVEDGNSQASINVHLNKLHRGFGIGSIAFRQACELSGLHEVLASIRKSNIASRIAAERAGFVEISGTPGRELLMIWSRK